MSCIDKWLDADADKVLKKYLSQGYSEDIAFRTYSARLLGQDPELVLHGGGNTSVKSSYIDFYGNETQVLCVKGSGWDLATIEPEGHPAVKLEPLQSLQKLNALSDEDMVSIQRQNLVDPTSPNPSVETLLHAFLPYKFIDHTHSIAILSLVDQPNGIKLCKEIFGNKLVIVPYVMPGFDLAIAAKKAYELALKDLNTKESDIEGMLLMKHGLFTFGETAKQSYQRMVTNVQKAEKVLPKKIELNLNSKILNQELHENLDLAIPFLRGLLTRKSNSNQKCIFEIRSNQKIINFIAQTNLKELVSRGVATPDHVIRTKRTPLILEALPIDTVNTEHINAWYKSTTNHLINYIKEYNRYFDNNNHRLGGTKTKLDPIPRLILIPDVGLISVGENKQSAIIAADIGEAWVETLLAAESIGQFFPVNEAETFDLEYWSLEQAKLVKKSTSELNGHVVVITGGGGVLGSQIAKDFSNKGAEIVILDLDIEAARKAANFSSKHSIWIKCDVTDKYQVNQAFHEIILRFGGVDILVSNAGYALQGDMSEIDETIFRQSMEINLFSHQYMAQKSVEIFRNQDKLEEDQSNLIGGQLLFNISKQALNPGKSFGTYGIAKSALLALMKQYAVEEGANRIRSNGVNADRIKSGLLTPEMIKSRSIARGITQDEYMSGNLLNLEVKPSDVSNAFVSLSMMKKTTGALITVDGGNVAAMVR